MLAVRDKYWLEEFTLKAKPVPGGLNGEKEKSISYIRLLVCLYLGFHQAFW